MKPSRSLYIFFLSNIIASGFVFAQADTEWVGKTNISIHEMVDFNFKSKSEIYDLRMQLATNYPQFIDSDYKPSESIFGQIQDGKPWWGILGRSYYGPGQQSITGSSEESRWIANPLLLVGLDSIRAMVVRDATIVPSPIYPIPLSLTWTNDRTFASVQYDVTSYLAGERRIHYPLVYQQMLTLVAYNARDMGFNFLYISPKESENITAAPNPVQILQFIHTGSSCGYPGGCNNMSPHQDGLEIKVERLPARAYLKLWKHAPASSSSPADMIFLIEMI